MHVLRADVDAANLREGLEQDFVGPANFDDNADDNERHFAAGEAESGDVLALWDGIHWEHWAVLAAQLQVF